MSKYMPLADHLAAFRGDSWRASFSEVERVLGFPLPASAGKHQAWWSNEVGGRRSHARSWMRAGWRTSQLDLPSRKVTFTRQR